MDVLNDYLNKADDMPERIFYEHHACAINDVKLIKAIKTRKLLWDTNVSSYEHWMKKDKLWEEVKTKLGKNFKLSFYVRYII